ncbi:MAG: hypothetical protein NC127_09575 [Muribaculum sp.]|nr:hypothetical protein [Muribaculum sp.]
MRKFNKKSLMTLIGVVVAMLLGSGVSQAASLNLGSLERGKDYPYAQGDEVTAEYTATEDGMVKFVFKGTRLNSYSDAEHKNELNLNWVGYTGNGNATYSFDMSKGQTVYFYNSALSTYGDGSICVASKPSSIELTSVTIQKRPDGKVSVSDNYTMYFDFSDVITAVSASVRINGKMYANTNLSVYGSSIQVTLQPVLMQAYKEGALKEGDEVGIRLVGVYADGYSDVKCNGNGRVDYTFTACGKPAELIGTKNTPGNGVNSMLSYYLPGDERAIVELEFDGELSTTQIPTATLSFGNPEDLANTPYSELLTPRVDGKKVIVDLAGKRRRPIDMIPGNPESSDAIVLGVSHIRTVDGQRVCTGSSSTYATYYYSYPIESVQYTVASDFTPARGATVGHNTPVEIWIMNGSKVLFDGVKLDYVEGGAPKSKVIAKENLTVEPDPESADDMLITFKMPADINADTNTDVKVSLNNMVTGDGFDHNSDVMGNYKFDASGIESVETDLATANGDVYNVAGICVLKSATLRDVLALPAGLYIFNGKKIAVK